MSSPVLVQVQGAWVVRPVFPVRKAESQAERQQAREKVGRVKSIPMLTPPLAYHSMVVLGLSRNLLLLPSQPFQTVPAADLLHPCLSSQHRSFWRPRSHRPPLQPLSLRAWHHLRICK